MRRKLIVALSLLGSGGVLFMTGVEVFLRKRSFPFWLRFFGISIGLFLTLIGIPMLLCACLVFPNIPDGLASYIVATVLLIYLYIAGALICQKQCRMREEDS